MSKDFNTDGIEFDTMENDIHKMDAELKSLITGWINNYKNDFVMDNDPVVEVMGDSFNFMGAITSVMLEAIDMAEETLNFTNHDFMTRFIIDARLQKWGEKVVREADSESC